MVWGRWWKHEGSQVVAVVDRILRGEEEGVLIGEGYFFSNAMVGTGEASQQDRRKRKRRGVSLDGCGVSAIWSCSGWLGLLGEGEWEGVGALGPSASDGGLILRDGPGEGAVEGCGFDGEGVSGEGGGGGGNSGGALVGRIECGGEASRSDRDVEDDVKLGGAEVESAEPCANQGSAVERRYC